MNKTFKRVLLLAAVVCMMSAMFVAVAATTSTCNHNWVETKALVADATCKTYGVYEHTCSYCKEVKYVQRLGHTLVEGETAATCTEPAKKGLVCTVPGCGGTYGEMKVVEGSKALGHDIEATVIAANCVDPAGLLQKCSRCDYRKVEAYTGINAVPALGHQEYVSAPAVKPTCNAVGWTEQISCLRENCPNENKIVKKAVQIAKDPTAHSKVLDMTLGAYVAPNCKTKTDGYGWFKCELCGLKDTAITTIAWEHSYVETPVAGKEATCGKDGLKNLECSVCGDKQYNVVDPATGAHTPDDDYIIPADCVNNAKQGRVCVVCKAVLSDLVELKGDEYKAKGHTLVYTTNYVPTCTDPSGLKITCSECKDYVVYRDIEGVVTKPATGHTAVAAKDNKAATCAEAGLTGHTVCSICGVDVEKGTVLKIDETNHVWPKTPTSFLEPPVCKPAKDGYAKYVCENAACGEIKYVLVKAADFGHTWGAGVVVDAATCTKEGKMKYTCTVCGATKTEAIEKIDHTPAGATTIPADCLNPEREGDYCTVCKQAIGETKVKENGDPATGHNFNGLTAGTDYIVYETANCEYPAGILRFCVVCKAKDFVPNVPGSKPLDHVRVTEETVPATCTEKGHEGRVTCELCGKELDAGREIPVDTNNHKPVLVNTIEKANCITMTNGVGEYECERCKKDLGLDKIAPAHTKPATGITTVPATCTKKGSETYLCVVCQKHITEEINVLPHNYVEYTATNPYVVCGETPKVGKVCTACGAVDGKLVAIEGASIRQHQFEAGVRVPADCYRTAGIVLACTQDGCDYEMFFPDDPTAVAGHKPKAEKDVAPTCKTPGYKDKVVCEVCGKTLRQRRRQGRTNYEP